MKPWLKYGVALLVGAGLAACVMLVVDRASSPPATRENAPADVAEPRLQPAEPAGQTDRQAKATSRSRLLQIANAAELWRMQLGRGEMYPSSLRSLAEIEFAADYDSLMDRAGLSLTADEVSRDLPLAWEKRARHRDGRHVVFRSSGAGVLPGRRKYRSTCVIKASKNEVAALIRRQPAEPGIDLSVIKEEILRYDRVMQALENTEVLREIQKTAEGAPELRGKLEQELYKRVVKNTQVDHKSEVLFRVSYTDERPDRAFVVLTQLTTHFVENALRRERNNARRAREMAQKELTAATAELERKESDLASYVQEHPSVTRAGANTRQDEFGDVSKELEKLNRQITAQQHKLRRYREQLENMPERVIDGVKSRTNPKVTVLRTELTKAKRRLASLLKMYKPAHPVVKTARDDVEATREELSRAEREKAQKEVTLKPNRVRDELESKRLELEAKIEYDLQTKSTLQLRKTKLEEELSALPAMEKERGRLRRARDEAEELYKAARNQFRRIDREFHLRMEGLVSFAIIAPARRPTEVIAPSGLPRVRFVTEAEFQRLMRRVDDFVAKQRSKP